MELSIILLVLPLLYLIFIKFYLHKTISWREWAINIVATIVIVVVVIKIGIGVQTQDTEIWNGQVYKKYKDTVSCSHSYSCNCRTSTDSKGNSTTTCDTCYEHFNDYDWVVKTTAGNLEISRVDRQGSTMPPRFRNVKIGESASREHSFTNYVKAVPESLFNDSNIDMIDINRALPEYPRVYDYYRINRVLNDKSKVLPTVMSKLNTQLNDGLRSLGSMKQVNIVVVFTNYKDGHAYKTALKKKWINGKKNDIIIAVGTEDGKTIDWVESFGWSKRELVNVSITSDLTEIKEVSKVDEISSSILKNIKEHFFRDEMKNYEYLEASIEPPMWVIILALFLGMSVAIGGSIFFHRKDTFGEGSSYSHYGRWRRK